jgi:hypothetical protein
MALRALQQRYPKLWGSGANRYSRAKLANGTIVTPRPGAANASTLDPYMNVLDLQCGVGSFVVLTFHPRRLDRSYYVFRGLNWLQQFDCSLEEQGVLGAFQRMQLVRAVEGLTSVGWASTVIITSELGTDEYNAWSRMTENVFSLSHIVEPSDWVAVVEAIILSRRASFLLIPRHSENPNIQAQQEELSQLVAGLRARQPALPILTDEDLQLQLKSCRRLAPNMDVTAASHQRAIFL